MSYKKKLLSALIPAGAVLMPLPAILLYKYLARDKKCYDKDGYNKYGYDRDGFDKNGYDKDGFNRQGLDVDGYDAQGYNPHGRNRAGYSKEEQFRLWQKQIKEWDNAGKALEKFRDNKAFVKCQRINECILNYICKMEQCKPRYFGQQTCVKAMIDACLTAGVLPDDLAERLNKDGIRFLFYKNRDDKEVAVFDTFKSTMELMEFWEKKYIQPYYTL